MASIISASTTSATALNLSGDTTGILQLATGATQTTAVTIDASQKVTFANSLTSPTFVTPILGTPTSGVLDNCTGTNLAKAWVTYNAVAKTISASFNVSSVTYNAVGDYTINFTSALVDANYSVSGTSQNASFTSGNNSGYGSTVSVGYASSVTSSSCKILNCGLVSTGTAVNIVSVQDSVKTSVGFFR